MKKSLLERFIKKYHLNGINNSAVWCINDGTLQVDTKSYDSKMFINITWKEFYGFENKKIGVKDTKQLLRSLGAISSDNVVMGFVNDASNKVAALLFSDSDIETQVVTSPLVEPDYAPAMINHLTYNAAIIMDDGFKKWFFNAYSVLGDEDSLFTVAMSKRTGKIEVIFGYRENEYRDRLSRRPATLNNINTVKSRIDFSARYLRNILKENSEFKSPILNVSDNGFASIIFSEDDLDSQYHLVKVDVES